MKMNSHFSYSTTKCPDFAVIAASKWIPEALNNFKEKLIKCEVNSKILHSGKNISIVLVQYLYHFKEDSEYVSKQQFSFIVDNVAKLILWQGDTGEYPHGALEDVRLLGYKTQLILEFEFFTGGTAGFWEDYYTYSDGTLIPININFGEEVAKLIPKGYSNHRTRINFKSMTAVLYLATKEDPNCCPSGRLELKIAIRNNELVCLSGKFISE
jgi:hypothetical protein